MAFKKKSKDTRYADATGTDLTELPRVGDSLCGGCEKAVLELRSCGGASVH